MLSLCELERALRVLESQRRGARLERVSQPHPQEVLLQLSGGEGHSADSKLWLLLSCRPGLARLSVLAKGRPAPQTPPGLTQYAKAHLEGGRLRTAELRNADRQAVLRFETRKERGSLLLQILGPRSNVYLLDAAGLLRASARPLAETRRDLSLGAPWRNPDSPPPRPGEDRFGGVPDAELLRVIEQHYASEEARKDAGRLRQRLSQALRKQRASLERKTRNLEKDAQSAEQAPALERMGELLKANLSAVKPGASEMEARDFESGAAVRIPLDPKLSPAKNLDALFKNARKAIKRSTRAGQELASLEERLAELGRLEEALEAAQDDAGLEALAEQPELARLLSRYFPGAPAVGGGPAAPAKKVWKLGKRELPSRLVPKRYRTQDGLEVWVGKNDEGNDLLTTRLARGNDLFLHLEGNPGSHVVLRTEKGQQPPQESLLEAAELAVQFSKAKKATRASVHIAAIKDVSKPSGAKPGLVYVHRGRTLQLRRDPERLKRVVEARIDE